MENVETLFFDESGTPADPKDRLFVVGGFALRGKTDLVQKKYEDFLLERNLYNKKGKRYSKEDYIHLSDFMCTNHIMPVTSFSYLDEIDLYYLKRKIEEFIELKDDLEKEEDHLIEPEVDKITMSKDRYIWMLQVAITIACSALGLAINRGKIEQMIISVDKYLSDRHNQKIINFVLQNFFEPSKFEDSFGAFLKKYKDHPETLTLIENLSLNSNFFSLELNAKGIFKQLSDSVCAMYRNKLQGNEDASGAWEVLSLFLKKNKKIHMCIDNDFSSYLKKIVSSPWAIPKS